MNRARQSIALVRRAAWAPVGVYILHAVAASIFRHEPYVDPAMHFLGGAAMTFFIFTACSLDMLPLGAPSRLAVSLISLGSTSVVGLCWELGELFSDVYLGSHTQFSVANTLRDLALDTLGAVVYLIVASAVSRMRSSADDR